MLRPRRLLFLLFVLLLVARVPAASVPCRADDVWQLCMRDTQCAFLYRDEKVSGITRALEFYQHRDWRPPYWPANWSAIGAIACDYGSTATTASGFLSAATTLTPSMATVLNAVVRYRMYEEGSVGCPSPEIMLCDDLTNQCKCACPLSATLQGSDPAMCAAAADACQTTVINWAIGLALAALVMILLAMGLALYGTITATNAVVALHSSPVPPVAPVMMPYPAVAAAAPIAAMRQASSAHDLMFSSMKK